MPKSILVGDRVFVPKTLLGLDVNDISPFHETVVRERRKRSVRVDVPGGGLSDWVGTRQIAINPGVLIIRIGDYQERQLLDPLLKSVLHFLRILLPEDHVRAEEIRTLEELEYLWRTNHGGYQQIILIGHGSPSSVLFGERRVSAAEMSETLASVGASPKEIISLCCETGKAGFGKQLSSSPACDHFIAPFHSIHGCVASQFCQNYMAARILDGHSVGTAFESAKRKLLGAATFRLWRAGKLKSGPK
jgi:hypothetical protein